MLKDNTNTMLLCFGNYEVVFNITDLVVEVPKSLICIFHSETKLVMAGLDILLMILSTAYSKSVVQVLYSVFSRHVFYLFYIRLSHMVHRYLQSLEIGTAKYARTTMALCSFRLSNALVLSNSLLISYQLIEGGCISSLLLRSMKAAFLSVGFYESCICFV